MAYLTIRIKDEEGYQRVAIDKESVIIGRSSSCDVSVRHSSVSRQHCRLYRKDEAWWVEDLGSHNGTFVGKNRVGEPLRLAECDVIRIGAGRLTFHAGPLPAEAPPEPTLSVEAETAPTSFAAQCARCAQWVSVAHLAPGQSLPCPRCGAAIARPADELSRGSAP
ncbi:MAG: FHA domain-containing protein [Planctomycetota bacterium]|nr:FHA domain-containing protein [Planctomycetota bacterium]MCX8039420.1 FHA domain-containing protein [Planctomycetota bacterium]MDW8373874.1 FHA domain-containing protein [Planctomycetota bacterium]